MNIAYFDESYNNKVYSLGMFSTDGLEYHAWSKLKNCYSTFISNFGVKYDLPELKFSGLLASIRKAGITLDNSLIENHFKRCLKDLAEYGYVQAFVVDSREVIKRIFNKEYRYLLSKKVSRRDVDISLAIKYLSDRVNPHKIIIDKNLVPNIKSLERCMKLLNVEDEIIVGDSIEFYGLQIADFIASFSWRIANFNGYVLLNSLKLSVYRIISK